AVQVLFEDARLVELALYAERDDHLPQLSAQAWRTWRHVTGELLGDGARPGDDPSVPEDLEGGAGDGEGIDAGVAEEACIFRRQDGVHDVLRQFIEGSAAGAGPFGAVLVDEATAPVEDTQARR